MKYAIIEISGHQYKVTSGDCILLDHSEEKELKPNVLLLVNEKAVKVGKPHLSEAKVTLKKLGDKKGEKLHIRKYKAKSRYRRKIGFRHLYSEFEVKL